MYTIGYDIGSSSVKACLLQVETGRVAASAFSPAVEMPILSPAPGRAEQHPQEWWCNLREATRRILAQGGDFVEIARIRNSSRLLPDNLYDIVCRIQTALRISCRSPCFVCRFSIVQENLGLAEDRIIVLDIGCCKRVEHRFV